MANSLKNARASSKYPPKFNNRENRQTTHGNTLAVLDAAYTIAVDDAITHVSAAGTFTVTLPTAGASEGRVLKIYQSGAGAITLSPSVTDVTLNAAGEWAEIFCDGTTWYRVAGFQA